MKEGLKKQAKDQCGEIMLESSFILVAVIVLLMVLLSLSFLFYQQTLMTTIATEIAADVAKNYKFSAGGLEIGEDDIVLDDVKSVKMFRSTFGSNKVLEGHTQRAKTYLTDRVGLSSLGLNSDNAELLCTAEKTGLGRVYIKVTVSQKTDFFLSGILEYSGIWDDGKVFAASAYAECLDLTAYTSVVNFNRYCCSALKAFSEIGELYNSIRDFISALSGLA